MRPESAANADDPPTTTSGAVLFRLKNALPAELPGTVCSPMKKAAKTIKYYLWGILNAMSEGINTKIQYLKRAARGYRNRDRFRKAIYFHLGGLDLCPKSA